MSLKNNESGQIGSLQILVSVAVTLMVIGAVFTIAPLVFEEMESSISYSNNSTWDPSTNADVVGGKDIWAYADLIGLVVLVSLVSLAIYYLRAMGGGF